MVGDTILTKTGDTVGMFKISRASKDHGLLVMVKMDPVIEDFFRGGGETSSVRVHGRDWHSEEDLRIYEPNPLRGVIGKVGGGIQYTLDRPGRPLTADPDYEEGGPSQHPVVNLSFLRLAGISGDQGLRFHVKTVLSTDGVLALSKHLRAGLRQFYLDYIAGVEVSVEMVTQEYRR